MVIFPHHFFGDEHQIDLPFRVKNLSPPLQQQQLLKISQDHVHRKIFETVDFADRIPTKPVDLQLPLQQIGFPGNNFQPGGCLKFRMDDLLRRRIFEQQIVVGVSFDQLLLFQVRIFFGAPGGQKVEPV